MYQSKIETHKIMIPFATGEESQNLVRRETFCEPGIIKVPICTKFPLDVSSSE